MSFDREAEYPYTLITRSDGLVYWRCDLCDAQCIAQPFSPNLQKAARHHIKRVHDPKRVVTKCPTCGHEETKWQSTTSSTASN